MTFLTGLRFAVVLEALVLLLGVSMSPPSAFAIEKPKYEVVEETKFEGQAIEVRSYASFLVAETTVEAENWDKAGSEGFRRIAAFIFGENQVPGSESSGKISMTAPVEVQAASEKIAMTAPVETQASTPGKWTIRFMMPSQYTLATLPKPKNPQVQIREVPASRRAVIVFSGRWTDANFAEHTEVLERFLKSRSLTAKGPLLSARYNAPFTPWFLRHNEIQAEI